MSKRLYVGNLSYNTNDDALKSLFSEYGSVTSASILMDRMTGRSRGFGFVEMDNDEEAMKAIEELNGKEVDGRKLVVNEARPKVEGDRPRGGGGSRFGRGGGNRFGSDRNDY